MGFSLVVASDGCSSRVSRASHCGGGASLPFNRAACVAARGLHSTGSTRVARGLSCSEMRGILRIRYQIHVSCIGKRILYHSATREAAGHFKHTLDTSCFMEDKTQLFCSLDL